MSKRKNYQKKNKIKKQYTQICVDVVQKEVPSDELQHMIANAIMEAEDMKAKREADKKAEELAEWHKAIGYDKSKTGIAKVWNDFSSTVNSGLLFVHVVRYLRLIVAPPEMYF